MKRLTIILVLISLMGVNPLQAQDDNTRFQWAPYDFSVDLPAGWVASASVEELILGLPEDVHAVEVGQPPAGVVVLVWLVEPALTSPDDWDTSYLAEKYSPYDSRSEIRMFGQTAWDTVNIPPIGNRQGMTAARNTYLVTVSGPTVTWTETLPMITDLIASIEAPSLQSNPQEQLTETVQWRHLISHPRQPRN